MRSVLRYQLGRCRRYLLVDAYGLVKPVRENHKPPNLVGTSGNVPRGTCAILQVRKVMVGIVPSRDPVGTVTGCDPLRRQRKVRVPLRGFVLAHRPLPSQAIGGSASRYGNRMRFVRRLTPKGIMNE